MHKMQWQPTRVFYRVKGKKGHKLMAMNLETVNNEKNRRKKEVLYHVPHACYDNPPS